MAKTAALGLVLLSAACGGGDSGGPSNGTSGTYQLVGIDEDGLPENEDYNWGTASFQGGELSISGDGTWEMTIHYDRVEMGDSQVLGDYGDWDVHGGDLHFMSEEYGDEFWGAQNGNRVRLTYDFDGDGNYETDFVFAR
jgi:hypothetical protein